jgi:toxin ParE1/3/4
MVHLILSPEAEQDLIDIWSYIAVDSPVNADHYIDKIYNKGVILSENPEIGSERYDLIPEMKYFPVDKYILYYRQIHNGVEIVRILHASRDMNLIFN